MFKCFGKRDLTSEQVSLLAAALVAAAFVAGSRPASAEVYISPDGNPPWQIRGRVANYLPMTIERVDDRTIVHLQNDVPPITWILSPPGNPAWVDRQSGLLQFWSSEIRQENGVWSTFSTSDAINIQDYKDDESLHVKIWPAERVPGMLSRQYSFNHGEPVTFSYALPAPEPTGVVAAALAAPCLTLARRRRSRYRRASELVLQQSFA